MVHSQLERSLFDLSFFKIAVLAVIALVVFGPEQLPRMAAQAGRALRDVRRLAEGARADLQQQLGPEFSEFDLNDLNPKHFVRKHLLDGLDGEGLANGSSANGSTTNGHAANGSSVAGIDGAGGSDLGSLLMPGESPPYDSEAT
jgi:sec-independent protein translocase protein TatB